MDFTYPVERFYAPWVATMWLASYMGWQWWASFYGIVESIAEEPRRPYLRLVASDGRLVGP
jgi:hypothetical protein